MSVSEIQVIELAKAICALRSCDDFDALKAIQDLSHMGFEDVSLEFVQEIYKFAKEIGKNIKAEEVENKVLELTRAVLRSCNRREANALTAAIELEKQDFKNVTVELIEAVYKQLANEARKHTKSWRKNAENALYYTYTTDQERFHDAVVWDDRFFLLCGQSDKNFHQLNLIDTYNDKSVQMSVQKSATELWLYPLHPLSGNFVALVEYELGERLNNRYFISLISIDFGKATCKKHQTLEYTGNMIWVNANKHDSTELVFYILIRGEWVARIHKLVGSGFVVRDPVQVQVSIMGRPCFNGCFYELVPGVRKCIISAYNAERDADEHFEVDFPEGYYYEDDVAPEWVGDKVFISLHFENADYVVACLNVQRRQLTILQFATELPIKDLQFVDTNELVVRIYGPHENEISSHKIPIRMPDLLQNIAWITLVKSMKKRDMMKGAYESARYFLPYNSFIRCPFVKPEKDEKLEPPKKRTESD